jgi:hypothetical protein
MKLELKPYIGINEIMFGMTSLEITRLLKKTPKKFKRSQDDLYETDDYDVFFIYYNDEGKCEAIEFNSDSHIELFNVAFFSTNYEELKEKFLIIDENIIFTEDGFMSKKYGFSVYIPDELDLIIESVIFFTEDYWK